MSGIVLSASVRQNLLSLQSTADLLATTQNRLSTGKKVNTALDNPTNYFTAASLDARAADINNLLDGIGNGVQVLQAANVGITSLQKLVDSAKSVANQALQTTVGFSTKSSFTSVVIDGATADNLVADQQPISTAFTGAVSPQRAAYTSTAAAAGTQLETAGPVNATPATLLSALTVPVAAADTLIVNGKTITFEAGANGLVGSGTAYTLGINTSLSDLVSAIDTLSGNVPGTASTATGGIITLRSGTASDLLVTGTALAKLEINAGGANTATRGGGALTAGALAGATKLSAGDGTAPSLSNGFAVGDTVTVNGRTLTFVAANSTQQRSERNQGQQRRHRPAGEDRRSDRLVDALDDRRRPDHAEHRLAERPDAVQQQRCSSHRAWSARRRDTGSYAGPRRAGRQDPEDRCDWRRCCHRHRVRCGSRPHLVAQPAERCPCRQ